jgi:hypothetical protein
VVCIEAETPDYTALPYTPYTNDDNLTIKVDWAKDSEINTLSVKMIDKNGEVTHR